MGDSDEPISILIDELRNEDISSRLKSMSKLPTIALALGVERTKSELIPFIIDSVYDEDEVLERLADELKRFIPLVGGPAHAHIILTPLESLAMVEETVVRDRAVQSLCAIAREMSAEHIEQYFEPLIRRLATGDWFTSRTSACGLFAVAYNRGTGHVKQEMRSLYPSLCGDETPMVRRAAASKIGPLVAEMEKDFVQNDFLKLYESFVADDQDSVRLLICPAFVQIIPKLDVETQESKIIVMLKKFQEDKSWRVRNSLANILVDLVSALDASLVNETINIFKTLVKDLEGEVRVQGAKNIFNFANGLPAESKKNLTMTHIIPLIKDLSNDPHQPVKTALASTMMKLAAIIGPENTNEHLLPLFVGFLKDECADVRLNVINTISTVHDVIGFESFQNTLLPAVLKLAEDTKWRVRLAILEHMPLSRIFKTSLVNHVFSIREAACTQIQKIVDIYGFEWARDVVLPKVFELAAEQNYLRRMTVLFQINFLMSASLKNKSDMVEIADRCVSTVCNMHKDEVANVKFNVAKTLGSMSTLISKKNHATVKSALDSLSKDSDIDVSFFANEALEKMAKL
ncbi:Oidioi.mRNA.OKI2018_I69.PAR.g12848.t1.cds [Oikopleura dioica]|uniref:Oidioi.mRNA.OKI2018_I69.PAR.g12848.t1.cds n=2 Tax=Oikopleura dioica TaxID=34765 RepID=A0ABN7S5D2_OIKDI|nr:Oidioi.mRNA.OKI2018_I69.PAR.g12848.t1.cds [Oikopleura dioica]